MDYGLAKKLHLNSLLKILYILPAVAYGQLYPLEDAEYDEQMVKGVYNRSVRLACGDIVQPMVVFWSFTKPGSLIPRAVAISNGLESRVEKASAILGEVSLKNSTLEIKKLQQAAEGHFMCQAMYEVDGEIKINNSTPVEGMPVVMICTVKEGTPPIAYSWQHYTDRDGMVVLAEAVTPLLNLTSANRTYMGWYTCTAHNEVNSQTSNGMYLDVIYGPDEPVISIEPFAINQHGFSANEQEEVIMTCLAPSNPPSHYIWFYNSSQVYSGQNSTACRYLPPISKTLLCIVYGQGDSLQCTCGGQNRGQKKPTWEASPELFKSIRESEEVRQGKLPLKSYQFISGVPNRSLTCSVIATKLNEFLMLTCDWPGGNPQVTLWWRDWRHHVLGGTKPSHNVFIMKPNTTLGGKAFTCMAAHPLWARTAECHVRLESPKLMVERSKVSLFEGSEVQLACFLQEYPNPPNVTISRLMYTRPRTEVELEWETRGSGNLTGFVVQRREAKKTGPKQMTSSWETVANNIDPEVRGRKLGGLDPAVVYAFRILAVNHRTTGYPSEVKTPADPPFNAYPVVIGAAMAGMIVATVISLLVFQYIIRNRENNPRLHDLLFRIPIAILGYNASDLQTFQELQFNTSKEDLFGKSWTPEDAEMPTGISDAANEQVEEASEQVGETSTTTGETPAEAIQEEAVVTSEDPSRAQEGVPAPSPPPEDPVNVTITVTATP
ncbi:hypothetical protein Chor_002391 [Crotalus horridus]